MHRKFIAIVIAATVAVTTLAASAAPARAGGDDLAKILAGVAAVAIIGKVVKDQRDEKREVSRRRPHVEPRPLPRRVQRRSLPRRCFRAVETRYGTARMFGKRCLQRHYRHVDSLPRACAQRIWTPNGVRRGFEPSCLRQHGYRMARG